MRDALRSSLLLSALLSIGCPEPPPGVVGQGQPGAQPGGDGGNQAGPGDAGPAADSSGSRIPVGMRLEPEGFGLKEGEGVVLSGVVSYDGDVEGQARVEILQSTDDESPPSLLHAVNLDALGPWSVIAPRDLGAVRVVAYIDTDQNGPSPLEPMAQPAEPVVVGTEDIAGIDLVLALDPNATPPAPVEAADGTVPQGPAPEGMVAGPPVEPPPVENEATAPAPAE